MIGSIETTSKIHFGDWTIEPNRNRIERAGESRTLEPRLMDILLYLCEYHGKVVSRNELLAAVWPGLVVTEDTLNKAISEIRKTFRDDSTNPQIIETIRKRGYRFIPSVTVQPATFEPATIEPVFSRVPPLPTSMRAYSFHFHWPSALVSAVAISVVWVAGLAMMGKPESNDIPKFVWFEDGSPDSKLIFFPEIDSLGMTLPKVR